MATLGDVPGPDAILPSSDEILPDTPSVLEVNGAGELTADELGLGDITTAGFSSDPFAFQIGAATDNEGGAYNDPQAKLHMPSYGPISAGSGGYPSGGATPTYGADPYVGGSVDGFDSEQLAVAQTIVETGKRVGATDRDIQIAIMVGLVESNLKNVDYGDRDSIGVFQQRDAWGSREDRLNVAKSAEMFFLGGQAGQQGLLDIPAAERESRPMGDLAQDVQVSAFPERYAEREQEAAQILGSVGGSQTLGSYKGKNPYDTTTRDGETIDYLTSAALDASIEEFGGDLRIMQGGHSHYAASGNTHAGLGVLDLDVPNGDWAGAMAALRKVGFAAWVRNVPGYGYAGDGAHIHAVLIGNERLSPQAQVQVQSYLNNDDGLKGSRPDDGPRDFVNNRFVWGDALKESESWRETVKADAEHFIGTPYEWAGETYTGADSVGMVRRAYKSLGVDLPKTAFGITYAADPIDIKDIGIGDLVAWKPNPGLGVDHFGIYLGDGNIIEGRPGAAFQLTPVEALNGAFGVPLSSLMKPPGTTPPAAAAAPTPAAPAPVSTPPNKFAHDMDPAYSGSSSSSGPAKPKPAAPPPINYGDRPDRHGPI